MTTPKIVPSGGENPGDDFVTGYMCMTDFEWELGMACGGNTVYPSEEDCRRHRKCVAGCGIVEVEVRFRRVVSEAME